MKLSLGTGAIKGFMLNHGEKLGVALVGMFVLLLVYQTVGPTRRRCGYARACALRL